MQHHQFSSTMPQHPPLICFYCHKIGHKALDCFFKFKDSRRQVVAPLRHSVVRALRPPPQKILMRQQIQQQKHYNSPRENYSGSPGNSHHNVYLQQQQQQQQKHLNLPLEDDRQDHQKLQQDDTQEQLNFQQQARYNQQHSHDQFHNQQQPHQQNDQLEQQQHPSQRCMFEETTEFAEALAYMSEQRCLLGREGFYNFQCETELGKKLKETLINFENNL